MIRFYPSDIERLLESRAKGKGKTEFQILITREKIIFGFVFCHEKWQDVSNDKRAYDIYNYIKRFREIGDTEWQYEYPDGMEQRWEIK